MYTIYNGRFVCAIDSKGDISHFYSLLTELFNISHINIKIKKLNTLRLSITGYYKVDPDFVHGVAYRG